MTVLLPSSLTGSWTTLDPPYDTVGAENYDQMNAIYGELFEQGAKGAIVYDLATSAVYSNSDQRLTIHLRHGVKFSDGTPFDAQAVAASINRDLQPSLACICRENFPTVISTVASGKYTVIMTTSSPDPNLIDAFISEAPDWTVDPTVLSADGEATYAQHPVGAGPFEVVSNTPSSELILKKNPHYWEPGHPLLSTLTFQSVASDEVAFSALQSGSGKVYMDTSTVQTVSEAKAAGYRIITEPATGAADIQLNPTIPPLNNILAREALYYATDPQLLDKQIFGGVNPITESPTGPGGLYYEPKVPGYRTYNLAKAKALVSQIGGLSFTLSSLNAPIDVEILEALYSEWSQAGINVTLQPLQLAAIVALGQHNGVQADYGGAGAYDPALLPGVASFFASTGPFTLAKDPTLTALINDADSTINPAAATTLYHKVFKYISDEAYAPFLYAEDAFDIVNKSVQGMGSLSEQAWENVSVS